MMRTPEKGASNSHKLKKLSLLYLKETIRISSNFLYPWFSPLFLLSATKVHVCLCSSSCEFQQLHDMLFNANITSFSTDTCIKHCSQLECLHIIIKRNGDKDLPVLYSLKASSVLMDSVGDLYSH